MFLIHWVILSFVLALLVSLLMIRRFCTPGYLLHYIRLKLRGDRLIRAGHPDRTEGPIVLVSLTSIPSRFESIIPTLNSLLLQSRPPHRIELSVPHSSAREKRLFIIPPGLEADPRIVIHREMVDSGPILKILPILHRETESETILITVDDDVIYPRRLVETLLRYHEELPEAALGFRGWRIPASRDFHESEVVYANQVDEPYEVDVLSGVSGVLYLRKHFRDDFFQRDHLPPEAFFVDDMCISGYLEQAGVKKYVIPFPMREPFSRYLMTSRSNPLWRINNCSRNGQVMLDFYFKSATDRGP